METVFPVRQPSAEPLILTTPPARTVVGKTESDAGAAVAAATQRVAARVAAIERAAVMAAQATSGEVLALRLDHGCRDAEFSRR
jgi:hypothetical protein